jgi:hypothetical protein
VPLPELEAQKKPKIMENKSIETEERNKNVLKNKR